MLLKLNKNKRSETFPAQKQKKLKTCFTLSKSLPYQQCATPALRKAEPLSLPETSKTKNLPMKETREKILEKVANFQTHNDVPAISQDIFEYTSQENDAVDTAIPQPLKSPYFPPASGSASASGTVSSQIVSSGTLSGNGNKTLEVTEEYNEHDVDIMETSSFGKFNNFFFDSI